MERFWRASAFFLLSGSDYVNARTVTQTNSALISSVLRLLLRFQASRTWLQNASFLRDNYVSIIVGFSFSFFVSQDCVLARQMQALFCFVLFVCFCFLRHSLAMQLQLLWTALALALDFRQFFCASDWDRREGWSWVSYIILLFPLTAWLSF